MQVKKGFVNVLRLLLSIFLILFFSIGFVSMVRMRDQRSRGREKSFRDTLHSLQIQCSSSANFLLLIVKSEKHSAIENLIGETGGVACSSHSRRIMDSYSLNILNIFGDSSLQSTF